MRICKVKIREDRVIINAEEVVGLNSRKVALDSDDAPRPELYAAFAALALAARGILELPDGLWTNLRVTGVSYTQHEDTGIKGAVMTCLVGLSDKTTLVLNTPHLPYEPYSEGAGGAVMPDDARLALMDLEIEASLYLSGDRAQADLLMAA